MANHDEDWRPSPDVERAYSFDAAFCADPNCGLHIVPKRESGAPICEIVMSPSQTLAIVEACKEALYDKATRRNL